MDPRHSQSRFSLHSLPPTIPTPTGPYSQYRGMFGGFGHGTPGRFSQLRYPPPLSRHGGPGLVRPDYIPPPPPLLKLGHHNIPPRSHQFYHDPVTTTTSSPLTNHLIGLLRQPPVFSLAPSTSSSSPPSPGPVPLTVSEAVPVSVSPTAPLSSSSSTLDDRDLPVVSEESDFSNIELSNASKCKEYRERNKQKRRKGEEEYQQEYEKYKKLKAKYDRQRNSIARLKEYYLKLLKKGDLACPKAKKANTDDDKEEGAISLSHDIEPPLVTIKSEIELNVDDIIVKNEC